VYDDLIGEAKPTEVVGLFIDLATWAAQEDVDTEVTIGSTNDQGPRSLGGLGSHFNQMVRHRGRRMNLETLVSDLIPQLLDPHERSSRHRAMSRRTGSQKTGGSRT
jgi:hypothetical protein